MSLHSDLVLRDSVSIERDKFLTEAMGECWHEWYWFNYHKHKCKNCNIDAVYNNYSQLEIATKNINFSTWEGFGKLCEWSEVQEWWETFVYRNLPTDHSFVKPDKFANKIYSYLKVGK
jgi:hypothetical protein